MEIMKLIANGKKITVEVEKKGNQLWFKFPFSRELQGEIKVMEGAKWHGYDPIHPVKQWSVADSARNRFQLSFLRGENPYANWDVEVKPIPTQRKTYTHQGELFSHWMATKATLWAAEMGTGKTLAAIEGIEHISPPSVWWVGPRSALAAVKLEFRKWNAKVIPTFMTYEGLVKILKDWNAGARTPMMVVFDEFSRCKTPTAQRSQAAQHLADSMREEWKDNCFLLGMSGSPAPKSPADWWKLCEILCPGYLREGTQQKFIERLAIVEKQESITGGHYSKIVAWKDNTQRCSMCSESKEHVDHTTEKDINPFAHPFMESKNEVEALYRRMKGLVIVKFKKDCLRELPDKIFRKVICKPKPNVLNAARLLTKTAKSAAVALVLMRELSDGFQYETVPNTKDHAECQGCGCESCGFTGLQITEATKTTEVPCPKEDALIDILEEHEDVGRLVIYAGFTGSIDRIERLCQKLNWETIRIDGRGWKFSNPLVVNDEEAILRFQNKGVEQRIVVIGHPQSGGMGLTLTASPSICYYSNSFNAEDRLQSMDRIHRPGMDINKGATIIDLIHLPTDLKVIDNLEKKIKLQSVTMGDLDAAMMYQYEEEESRA